MRLIPQLSIFGLALALGCSAGTAERAAPPEPISSAGGDAPARPSGPPPSYLPPWTKVLMRVDVSRIRRSPLAPDVSSALLATTTWQALAGRSGTDPIQDFDAILVGADQVYANRRIAVLRHVHTEAEVRRRVLQMAIDAGTELAWREVGGVPAVSWPMTSTVPYSLLLTAEHEVVLAPDEEMTRIVEVARDHAARRTASDAPIEPQLAFRAAEIATFVLDVPPPRREGYPDPPTRTRIEVDEVEAGAMRVVIHAVFGDEAQARAGYDWLRGQAQHWSQQMMVRAIGMHRPLEEAHIGLAGSAVELATQLTFEEVRRLFGLIALAQLAQPPS